ncbi:MAG: guanylate kinase [Bacteroidia bacterium]
MLTHPARVFIVSAPSGAGKTTLVRAMMERYGVFALSISATTRAPRVGEQEGVDYYFMDAATFAQRREAGDFLEWEEVYPGRYYGTLRSEVDRILDAGLYPIFDVDVKGGLNIKQYYGVAAVSIFIRPPREDVLLERLQQRNTDSPADIERRYAKAREELAYAPQFDYVIVNDVLPHAIESIAGIIERHLVVQPD